VEEEYLRSQKSTAGSGELQTLLLGLVYGV